LYKDIDAGLIDQQCVGRTVHIAGWVHRRRDHGKLIFIDLRDRSGLVQVVFDPEISEPAFKIAEDLRSEFVITIAGTVNARPQGTINLNMATGTVEIAVSSIRILNRSKTPPFYINEEVDIDENMRLKYRYLDFRRERMRNNLILRHKVTDYIHKFLDDSGFLEVETPILTKSTPEGARDYLVPARLYPGQFFALPQSPQQMKQLLMVGGIERYYQIARCFRDEDSRSDRQPEFTQLDIEMSFIDESDILKLMHTLLAELVKKVVPGRKFNEDFPVFSYHEAMNTYGSDKPDLRFDVKLYDIVDLVKDSAFGVFRNSLADGKSIKAICVPGIGHYNKSQLDNLQEMARSLGAAGVMTVGFDEKADMDNLTLEQIRSVAAKHMGVPEITSIAKRLGAKAGDLILIIADCWEKACEVLGDMRRRICLSLNKYDSNELKFCFITNFPLFKWDEENKRWDSMHHPFTAPTEADEYRLYDEQLVGTTMSRAYDIACNGYEIGGGSIRIHNADMQRHIFHILKHSDSDIEDRFGHLLEAFSYGAPPHGGVALGLDRLVMILAGENSIRDVIPFPKNQNAQDLLFSAPSIVEDKQLKELHIDITKDKKEQS